MLFESESSVFCELGPISAFEAELKWPSGRFGLE